MTIETMNYTLGNHLHDTNDISEWAKLPKQKQWCEIKENFPDTVLFVHVGKFYELFHQDADVLVSISEAPYMKGVVAHTGFPVSVMEKYIGILNAAGHKNIRII